MQKVFVPTGREKGGFHMIIYREASTLAQDLGIGAGTLYAVAYQPAGPLPKAPLLQGRRCAALDGADAVLKEIQRRIAPQDPCGYAGVPLRRRLPLRRGHGAKNACSSWGRHEVLRLDILHFFDSVRYTAVKDAAFPPGGSRTFAGAADHAVLLPGRASQGAPTSPAIANLVLQGI